MIFSNDEWANRWLGGFCTLGVEGLQPIREKEYPAHGPLRDMLTLPDSVALSPATLEDALAAWSSYLNNEGKLLLVKSTDRARRLLMEAFGIADGEPVGIPANTRRALSESVKRAKGKPLFIELDANLEFEPETSGIDSLRLHWTQPVGGLLPAQALPGKALLVDYSTTLPAPDIDVIPGAATVWGLHLGENSRENGALIAFSDNDLYRASVALFNSDEDLPDLDKALAQCQRLGGPDGLGTRQRERLAAGIDGLIHSGSIPQAEVAMSPGLAFGIAVRIPDEADVPTFISYVRNENTPLDWFPEVQPIFFVTNQLTRDQELTRQSATNLSRWVFSPIGPFFTDEEVMHAVLGPVKAAEYTGVRWYTDPERARWYNDLMVEWYGPDHDAYRCAFTDKLPQPVAVGDQHSILLLHVLLLRGSHRTPSPPGEILSENVPA